MAGRPSAATEAARKEYQAAKIKPTALELARKYGINESTVHRCAWFVPLKDREKKHD